MLADVALMTQTSEAKEAIRALEVTMQLFGAITGSKGINDDDPTYERLESAFDSLSKLHFILEVMCEK
ncbi:hypothetical protein VCR14J2_360001 [Vibrio coralliirubri]|nr:hypothetical protein VCR14J2_360001 [Vibrio coralliirubri]